MPDDPVLMRLLAQFAGVERACVAFSGGADSSLVLAAAARALGPGGVVAVTATSPTYLDEELAAARALAEGLGVEHVVVATHEFDDERFVANSRERCYFCKAGLLDELVRVAAERGGAALVDGANADDVGDHRPGMRAAAERGVLQPLLAAGVTKAEVRRLARERSLAAAERPESQEICFVPGDDCGAFVARRLPPGAVAPGPVVDAVGRRLGTHRGLVHYTVGQRRGLGLAAGRPLYVARLEPATNTLVVAEDAALWHGELVAEAATWLVDEPAAAFRAAVRIRSRHEAAPATLEPAGGGAWRVRFDEPQRAITPGQVAAFYDGDTVLGAGIIR